MRNHEEHNMQVEFFRHARIIYPELERLMFAVPNAKNVTPRQGAWMKKEGVTAGVHDVIVLVPKGTKHYMTIEFKLPKFSNHRLLGLSDKQLEFMNDVQAIGGWTTVCHSTQEALDELDWYMGQ